MLCVPGASVSAGFGSAWRKCADSGRSPSQPGCLWNLELRCNVRENSSCFDEARSGSLSACATRPPSLLPLSLPPSLPVSQSALIEAQCQPVDGRLRCIHSAFIAFMHSVSAHLLQLTSFAVPSYSFLSSPCTPSFALVFSPSPSCLLCPLPHSLTDCCIPALPSDRGAWTILCFRHELVGVACFAWSAHTQIRL